MGRRWRGIRGCTLMHEGGETMYEIPAGSYAFEAAVK